MFINKFSMIKQYQYPILLTLKLTSGNKIIFQNYQIKIQRIFNKHVVNVILKSDDIELENYIVGY